MSVRGREQPDHPSCSRNKEGVEADDLLCSRNAHKEWRSVSRRFYVPIVCARNGGFEIPIWNIKAQVNVAIMPD